MLLPPVAKQQFRNLFVKEVAVTFYCIFSQIQR
jgi:hypothetical protein